MSHFVIPQKFDEELELEVGEDAYIIKETEKPTKIVFCRGSIRNKTIVCVSEVAEWSHGQKKKIFYNHTYAVVKAPAKLIPNQKLCEKLMCLESDDGDFYILLK